MLPVVVLSGGLATRLRPVTEKIPKSLIEINGEPFVFHQLRLFEKNGVNRVHFCLGYLGEMVEEIVDKSEFRKSMNITYSYDGQKLLGTGGAIKKAFPYISDAFFITYGDSYLEIRYSDVESFYQLHKDTSAGVMVIYKNNGQFDKSNVVYENGELYYSKKVVLEKMLYIDYGISILTKSHFNNTPNDEPFDLSEILEQLSVNGKLLGYEVHNRFYEIGSFSGIEEIGNHLKIKS